MEKVLDYRGLACPLPVIKTKEFIEKQQLDGFTVIVDNLAAKENVTRFLTRSGYSVSWEESRDEFKGVVVKIRESGVAEPVSSELVCSVEKKPEGAKKILVLIATDSIGRDGSFDGSRESSQGLSLGRALMKNFIATLKEMRPDLWRLVFLNSGVSLTVEGAPFLNDLMDLEASGVSILVCGTCLNFYGLIDKKKVGETTNMLDIVTSMGVADKVITIT